MDRLDLQRIEEAVSIFCDTSLISIKITHTNSPQSTVLIFQILNMLVDIPTIVTCYSVMGFTFLPLPCPAPMWNAPDHEGWSTSFQQWYEKRTLYGLSVDGALTTVQKDDAGLLKTDKAEWEGWVAELGDIGTLVMIVAPLK